MLLAIPYLGVLTLGLAGAAAVAARMGEPAVVVAFAGAAVLLALVTGGTARLLRVRRRWRPDAVTPHELRPGEPGVRIRYSGWWFGWLVALVVAVTGYAGAALVGSLRSDLLPDELAGRAAVFAVVGVVAIPYCGWFLWEVARGRVARGQVVLTPTGVHHRGLVHEEFVAWESMVAVAAVDDRGPVIAITTGPGGRQWRRTSRVSLQRRPADPLALTIHGRVLAVDSAVLYHALRHYHAHPDHRSELATAAGVTRIRGDESS